MGDQIANRLSSLFGAVLGRLAFVVRRCERRDGEPARVDVEDQFETADMAAVARATTWGILRFAVADRDLARGAAPGHSWTAEILGEALSPSKLCCNVRRAKRLPIAVGEGKRNSPCNRHRQRSLERTAASGWTNGWVASFMIGKDNARTIRHESVNRRRGPDRRMLRRIELDAFRADIEACQAQVNRMERIIRELRQELAGLKAARRPRRG